VTSFKTSYENTFTVFVAQARLNSKARDFKIKFKYTGYQLWESPVKGFLSSQNQDFMIMSKDGMSYIRLDENLARRAMRRKDQAPKMVHSLSSMNYLKVENGNMLMIENQLDSTKLIMVQQARKDQQGNFQYEEIYKIKLEAMALNDLMFIQGLFLLDSVTEIIKMIELQP
jgi:DNA-binding Xre family transcriptional regulator